VAGVGQLGGQSRADPPTSDDDDVHNNYRTRWHPPAQLIAPWANVAAEPATRRSGSWRDSLIVLREAN
jgi:hypothetical protein